MQDRIARIAAFAARHPQLLPDDIRALDFLARLAAEAPLYLEHETAIRSALFDDADFIALCHWTANIDNGWFWRDTSGVLHNGMMDWGQVGQMNVAQGLYAP